jgi:DNA-damage-inducible protein D
MSDQPPERRIALFQRKEIRRVIHNNEWWFVISDIVAALTDSTNPADYLKKLRKRDEPLSEAFKGGGQLVPPLGLEFDTAGGRQLLQCWNTEGVFRLIQSIPSPKAEPFKRWLAKMGYERIQEIEDPELATKRTRALYKAKGYSDDWIEKRMRSIAIRDELTDEWKKRGVKEQREYAILTAEISKATFGLTPTEYAEFKKLKRENLRDHMTDLELIFSMLGEAATTEIARNKDTQGFHPNRQAAHEGGTVAGNARRELEQRSGRKVVTSENYLALTQSVKSSPRCWGAWVERHHPSLPQRPRHPLPSTTADAVAKVLPGILPCAASLACFQPQTRLARRPKRLSRNFKKAASRRGARSRRSSRHWRRRIPPNGAA